MVDGDPGTPERMSRDVDSTTAALHEADAAIAEPAPREATETRRPELPEVTAVSAVPAPLPVRPAPEPEKTVPEQPAKAVAVAPVASNATGAPTPPPAATAADEGFVLPMGSLQAIAESAGLQWVNSDAEKIRAVQAAMEAEPAPAHVPRERKAASVVDDGPLVLVETRKDLSQIKLPFEQAQGPQPPG